MVRETLGKVLDDLIPPLLVALPRRLFVVVVVGPVRRVVVGVLLEAVAINIARLLVFSFEKRIPFDLVLSLLLEVLLV